MVDTPRKTFPELQALSAPVVDSDVLAVYRSPGPAKRTTAATLKTYMQTGVALLATLAASGGSALIGFIQSGTGATLRTLQDKIRKDIPITPFDFGAVGDKTTDDTAALAALATYVNSLADNITDPTLNGKRPAVLFPFCAGFRTTATVVFDGWVDIEMQSPLWVTAAAGTPIVGLRIKNNDPTAFEAPRDSISTYDVRRVTQSDWTSESDIGVEIEAQYVSRPYIKVTQGFCIGFKVNLGYGTITLGDHRGHKNCLIVSSATQFTNALRVNGGTFASDGANPTISQYGLTLRPSSAGMNSITLDGQSYELPIASRGFATPLWLDGSTAPGPINWVRAMNMRVEYGSGTVVKATGEINDVDIGIIGGDVEYSDPISLYLDDQSTGNHNINVYFHTGAENPGRWVEVFSTGKLNEKAIYMASGRVNVQNMDAITNVGAAPATQTFSPVAEPVSPTTVFDTDGYMNNPGPFFGARIKLNGATCLAISGTKKPGAALDLNMVLFNAAGTQLTASGLIQNPVGQPVTSNTGIYGGLYNLGINPVDQATRFEAIIGIDPSVAVVFISVSRSSHYTIKALDIRPVWFCANMQRINDNISDSIPLPLTNAVAYADGKVVYNNIIVGGASINSWTYVDGAWSPNGYWTYENVIPTYNATNVTTDRSFDADTVAIAELADVVGTLINDLRRQGYVL
jgi:hypothetical protein